MANLDGSRVSGLDPVIYPFWLFKGLRSRYGGVFCSVRILEYMDGWMDGWMDGLMVTISHHSYRGTCTAGKTMES